MPTSPYSDFIGTTILDVNHGKNVISFVTDRGTWVMQHWQDCCEDVYIEDVNGDLSSLIGGQVVVAEARSSGLNPDDPEAETYEDFLCVWTFYTIRTTRGDVTIRWYGESNGYYAVDVDFDREE
jgi:hypothetical protein